LRDANLRDANLRYANLSDAKVATVKWPSPTMVLLANWRVVPDELTQLLMKYDMSNHPNHKAFEVWVKTGACPYHSCSVQRAANFQEQRKLFDPNAPLLSAYELMQRLLKEKCIVE